MEAGGVEPPSEKPCHQKTTCLAGSLRGQPVKAYRAFAGGGQNPQETPPASPMVLGAALRTEARRPAR